MLRYKVITSRKLIIIEKGFLTPKRLKEFCIKRGRMSNI